MSENSSRVGPVVVVLFRPNHQVSDDAAAGWILARVIKFIPERDQYHVRDEDDHSNVMTVPSSNVIRLMDDNVNDVKKDDTVRVDANKRFKEDPVFRF